MTPGMGRSPSSDRGIGIRKGSLMIQLNSAGASNSSSSSPEPAVAGWRVDHCADGERARAGRPLVRPAAGTPIPTPSPTQGGVGEGQRPHRGAKRVERGGKGVGGGDGRGRGRTGWG